jgi:uncharacterized protein YihD (DUF1040 family)
MRDPKRIKKVLKEIKAIWKAHPDLRLCQMICNLMGRGIDIYYLEDEYLVKELKKLYK